MASRRGEIHIFDLDHTLVLGDTFFPFLLGLFRIRPALIGQVPGLAIVYLRFRFGGLSNQAAKAYFLSRLIPAVKGQRLDHWVERHVTNILKKKLNQDLTDWLEYLRGEGATLVLATASPDIYVLPLARSVGIRHVLCTRMERDSLGQLTGKLDGNNCYGGEKAHQIKQLLQTYPIHRSWFYSDHESDMPSLLSVDQGVMVRPTRSLRRIGSRAGLALFGVGFPAQL